MIAIATKLSPFYSTNRAFTYMCILEMLRSVLPEILFRRCGRPAPEPIVGVLLQVAHARRGPQPLVGRALRWESGARALIARLLTTKVTPVTKYELDYRI